ncbi:MAG: hypothetical protein EB066_04610, partial [Betaproteobacteria bacterium]|nr:hypothetical protein [Betaproteobacteria bacterium]
MSGANTYSGTTAVNGGTLTAANATALGTNAATVGNGATLAIGAAITKNNITNNGTISIATGGNLTANALSGTGALSLTGGTFTDSSTAGTSASSTVLNVGAVTLSGSSTLALQNVYNRITSSGSASITGSGNLFSITGDWAVGAGAVTNNYTLLSGTSLTASGITLTNSSVGYSMSLGNTATVGRSTYGFYTNATSLYLAASSFIGNLTWAGGATGNWNTATNNTPWVNNVGGAASAFYTGDNVTLSTNNPVTITVTNTGVSAGSITSSASSGTTTLTGGAVTGTSLTQSGAGTLAFSNNVTISGTETVSAGTLTVASGFTNTVAGLTLSGGTINGSGVVTNSAAYDMQSGTANVVLQGTSGLNKTTTNTVTLGAANTYSGSTIITSGVLNIQNNSALGGTGAGTTVNDGAALQLQGDITVTGEALSLGGVGVNLDGALRNISGTNTYAGVITLTATSTNRVFIFSDAGLLTLNTGTITGSGISSLRIGGNGNMAISS